MVKRKRVPTKKVDSVTTGKAQEAEEWVTSSKLPVRTKKRLLLFIRRFSDLEFYQETAETFMMLEEKQKIKLPLWLKKIRQTLAFVFPGKQVTFQLDGFDGSTPREENVADIWYAIGLLGYANDDQRAVLERGNLFPIGYWQGGDSTLAIRLDGKDKAIYEFAEDDLLDNQAEGSNPLSSVRVVYNDYSDLFKHIVLLKHGSKVIRIEEETS
ncbi:MAG: hypothetical protein KA314_26670 [Chloroflexi bacterium]|nr:hypothetical protein [Chloroflexota bacterium]MBP8059435.1 hypothetical protein [Chloroflexota bacterium]